MAGAFADAGGEILSFVGDGFLAIFPCERHKRETQDACLKVLRASQEAIRRMAATNAERVEAGRPRCNSVSDCISAMSCSAMSAWPTG